MITKHQSHLVEEDLTEKVIKPFVCGVVLFDHPSDLTAGSAFLPNTPVQRIRSLNDLRNDVIWLSNLPVFEERIKKHPVVRSQFFLKISLSEIAQDIGIQASYDGQMQPEDAQRVSEVLTRSFTVAAKAYGWATENERALMTQELYFSSSIRKFLPQSPVPDARSRDELAVVFTHAYQDKSAPSWDRLNYLPNSIYITLRFNYVNYVGQLLAQPVPNGKQWMNINEGGVALIDDPLEHCLNLDKPCFVRATVEWDNASNDLAALAAYGQAGKSKNPMRLWLSQPELKWMSRFATITINYIWIDQSGYGLLPRAARLPELFDTHPESYLSYSAHLVAFNHYQALTSHTWNRRQRSNEASLWAMWIKALDRAYMFSIALKAHERGFHIDRYGDGAIRLKVAKDAVEELMEFKSEFGFVYPDLASINQSVDQ